ncbi:MAG: hypothetical protein MZU95_05895 [Desulfomicrobium escambiense]|nr:hypothetical protein [Desulfomicrobium escambiense]
MRVRITSEADILQKEAETLGTVAEVGPCLGCNGAAPAFAHGTIWPTNGTFEATAMPPLARVTVVGDDGKRGKQGKEHTAIIAHPSIHQ